MLHAIIMGGSVANEVMPPVFKTLRNLEAIKQVQALASAHNMGLATERTAAHYFVDATESSTTPIIAKQQAALHNILLKELASTRETLLPSLVRELSDGLAALQLQDVSAAAVMLRDALQGRYGSTTDESTSEGATDMLASIDKLADAAELTLDALLAVAPCADSCALGHSLEPLIRADSAAWRTLMEATEQLLTVVRSRSHTWDALVFEPVFSAMGTQAADAALLAAQLSPFAACSSLEAPCMRSMIYALESALPLLAASAWISQELATLPVVWASQPESSWASQALRLTASGDWLQSTMRAQTLIDALLACGTPCSTTTGVEHALLASATWLQSSAARLEDASLTDEDMEEALRFMQSIFEAWSTPALKAAVLSTGLVSDAAVVRLGPSL
jgi:hypothetical protein